MIIIVTAIFLDQTMQVMRRGCVVLMLCMAGTLLYAQKNRPYTIYDYLKMKTVKDVALSPDGTKVAFSVVSRRPVDEGKGNNYKELFIMPVDSREIIPILEGKNDFSEVQWTPDSRSVSCLAKFDSSLKKQVFRIPIDTKVPLRVTDVKAGIRKYSWNPAGKGLAYTSLEERPVENKLKRLGFDAEVYEEGTPDIRLFWFTEDGTATLNKEGSVFDFAWSPDGNMIAAQIAPLNLVDQEYMFKRIHLIEVESGKKQLLVDNPGKLTSMAWSPDSRHLAFVAGTDSSDPVSGSLFAVDIPNGKRWEAIHNYTLDFEGSVNKVAWKDNMTMLFSSDESVASTLREIQIGEESSTLLTEHNRVVFSEFNLAEGHLVMVANTSDHPDELYSLDLDNRQFTRLTFSNPWMSGIALARQEKISYKARDGLTIEGVLQYPIDFEEGKRYPMICVIHGGPESCIKDGWTTSYSRWGNIAAGQGYFVFMPNYRSSSGRGVAYSKMDHMDLGDEEFLDVIDGIEYLSEKGYIDKAKVGIGGGSYGGYFSALGATKYSEHFAAAIPFVGVSNQLSKVNLTDIPYEIYQVHWTIWPNEDPELFYDRSPVKYSSNSKTPTLILHGKEDTRVHPSQSLELYRQLKLHGNAPVRLIWYPGEGHGNKNTQSQLDFNLRTMRWFNHYLKGEGDPDELPPLEINYQLEKLSDTSLEAKPNP